MGVLSGRAGRACWVGVLGGRAECGVLKNQLDAMAAELGALHVDLDEIRWLPNWKPRPLAETRELLVEALARAPGGRWVVSGNYTKLSAIMRETMTALVWARPGFYANQRAIWWRTAARWLGGGTCCNGNRETLSNLLQLNDGSILFFGWSAHARMVGYSPKGKLQVIVDEERTKGRLKTEDIVTLRSMADADLLVACCRQAQADGRSLSSSRSGGESE